MTNDMDRRHLTYLIKQRTRVYTELWELMEIIVEYNNAIRDIERRLKA